MDIKLKPFDQFHVADSIRKYEDELLWNAQGNTHTLIIRDEYGANIHITNRDVEDMQRFDTEQFLSGQTIRLRKKRFAVLLPAKIAEYKFPLAPASYGVFCFYASPESNEAVIYVPTDECYYTYDISCEVKITSELHIPKKKLFSRKADAPYYTVRFPVLQGYTDGDIKYGFDGLEYSYPVTKEMLGKQLTIPSFGGSIKFLTLPNKGYIIKD